MQTWARKLFAQNMWDEKVRTDKFMCSLLVKERSFRNIPHFHRLAFKQFSTLRLFVVLQNLRFSAVADWTRLHRKRSAALVCTSSAHLGEDERGPYAHGGAVLPVVNNSVIHSLSPCLLPRRPCLTVSRSKRQRRAWSYAHLGAPDSPTAVILYVCRSFCSKQLSKPKM